jgi:hypothetical protein
VPADLRHADVHPQPRAALGGDQLYLVDVETEVAEAAQALGDPVALLVQAEGLLAGDLLPHR